MYVPNIGWISTHESTRKLMRLVERDQAEVLAVTITKTRGKYVARLRVSLLRPQRHYQPLKSGSVVGVDVGERVLAVVAAPDGTIFERVPNPKPLLAAITKLKRLNRKLARQKKGSNNYTKTRTQLTNLHAKIAAIRADAIHKLTTRLTKTHGVVVIEDLNVAGMKKGGSKHMRDAALGKFQTQMTYKADWYNCQLIKADRWFPSTKTCSVCDHVGSPGRQRQWTCQNCHTHHDRDENAAVNLARYGQKLLSGRVDPACDLTLKSEVNTPKRVRGGIGQPTRDAVTINPHKAETAQAA